MDVSPFGTLNYATDYYRLPRRLQNVDYFLRVKRHPAGATIVRPALVPNNRTLICGPGAYWFNRDDELTIA